MRPCNKSYSIIDRDDSPASQANSREKSNQFMGQMNLEPRNTREHRESRTRQRQVVEGKCIEVSA